jgi:hypothetical protein
MQKTNQKPPKPALNAGKRPNRRPRPTSVTVRPYSIFNRAYPKVSFTIPKVNKAIAQSREREFYVRRHMASCVLSRLLRFQPLKTTCPTSREEHTPKSHVRLKKLRFSGCHHSIIKSQNPFKII